MNRRFSIALALLPLALVASPPADAAIGIGAGPRLRPAPGDRQVRRRSRSGGRRPCRRGSASSPPPGPCAATRAVDYATPDYVATASSVHLERAQRPRHPDRAAGGARRLGHQTVELPALGRAGNAAGPDLAGRDRRDRRLGKPRRGRAPRAPAASPSPCSTPASPTAASAGASGAAPTSAPVSSSRATTSSPTARMPLDETATAPTSPARSPRRPTTGSG